MNDGNHGNDRNLEILFFSDLEKKIESSLISSNFQNLLNLSLWMHKLDNYSVEIVAKHHA